MAVDIVSYEMGRLNGYSQGKEDGAKNVVLTSEDVTLTYDEETKTVTLTKGGDENNG